MRQLFRVILIPVLCLLAGVGASAQSAAPSAEFFKADGEPVTDISTPQDAPLTAHFYANPTPEDLDGYTARWEWKIWNAADPSEVLLHRFEQDITYTFMKSGQFKVQLYATFTRGNDSFNWPEEGEEEPIEVNINASQLVMPNAFSPNGDGFNDIYNAKSGYQSIIKFQATIFNRWGQRIYSWNNPDRKVAGWDGTWHGKRVNDGVYYVVVVAEGADGQRYNIRKDVNVLTGDNRQQGVSDEDL